MSQKKFQNSLSSHCVTINIDWHFNPPAPPHYGGLWEANIKSTKTILYKNMGILIFTFEELNTLCCQIEAIGRPLCALSDGTTLTPKHFLIGCTLQAVSGEDLGTTVNHRKPWNSIHRIIQNYWKHWSTTYLNTLQQRSKWRKEQENLAVGTIVVLRENGKSSTQWPMARVMEVFPSQANARAQTVHVRTPRTELTHPILKLVGLPVEMVLNYYYILWIVNI